MKFMCGIFIRGDGCDLASTELTILFLCKESLVLFQDPIIDHANKKKNRITAVRLQHKNVNLA